MSCLSFTLRVIEVQRKLPWGPIYSVVWRRYCFSVVSKTTFGHSILSFGLSHQCLVSFTYIFHVLQEIKREEEGLTLFEMKAAEWRVHREKWERRASLLYSPLTSPSDSLSSSFSSKMICLCRKKSSYNIRCCSRQNDFPSVFQSYPVSSAEKEVIASSSSSSSCLLISLWSISRSLSLSLSLSFLILVCVYPSLSPSHIVLCNSIVLLL